MMVFDKHNVASTLLLRVENHKGITRDREAFDPKLLDHRTREDARRDNNSAINPLLQIYYIPALSLV